MNFLKKAGNRMIAKELLKQISEEYSTPCYIYDAGKIRENCRKITDAFRKHYPGTVVHYAVKANSNQAVLEIIRNEGLSADCSSPFELLVSDKCGFEKEKIMYTGNYENPDDFAFATEYASIINLDDATSFDRLLNFQKPEMISFRINPGIGRGGFEGVVTGGVDAKFGIPYEKAFEVYQRAFNAGIRRFGIHMMTGSNNLEPLFFAEITDKLMHIAGEIFTRLGVVPEYVDIGGGFGIPYSDEEPEINIEKTAELVSSRFIENCIRYNFGKPVLRIEPGRYITGNSGILLSKVTGLKESYRNYAGLDAGMNSLLRPALYGAFHRAEAPFSTGHQAKISLCGRICENSDIFVRDIFLPKLKEGDLILFKDCGAYGFTMSSNYNGRPRPAEVLVDNGKIIYVRKKENTSEMLKNHFKGQYVTK
jgi:diaminopimelate decarboxylase